MIFFIILVILSAQGISMRMCHVWVANTLISL